MNSDHRVPTTDGRSDLRQSPGWARFMESQGWKVEKVQSPKSKVQTSVFTKKVPILGSIVKIQRPPEPIPFDEIDRLARDHRAMFVKLEPSPTTNSSLLTSHSFRRDSWPLLPSRTIYLDLTQSEAELWAAVHGSARRGIRRARREAVEVRCESCEDGNLHIFHRLLKECGRRQKFVTPSFAGLAAKAAAFGSKARLLLAYDRDGSSVAGVLLLIHGTTAYYHRAASNRRGRDLRAPYLLVWELLRLAKSEGCRILDFEGISDPRYPATEAWQGLTEFKMKFGGETVQYPGSFTKFYSPWLRLIFAIGESRWLTRCRLPSHN